MAEITIEVIQPTPVNITIETAPGAAGTSVAWDNVTGKPLTFAPSVHTHPISEVNGLQTALDGKAALIHIHAIGDLSGVSITSPANDQVLAFESSTGLWKNKTASGGGGGITNGQSIVNALIFG